MINDIDAIDRNLNFMQKQGLLKFKTHRFSDGVQSRYTIEYGFPNMSKVKRIYTVDSEWKNKINNIFREVENG